MKQLVVILFLFIVGCAQPPKVRHVHRYHHRHHKPAPVTIYVPYAVPAATPQPTPKPTPKIFWFPYPESIAQ